MINTESTMHEYLAFWNAATCTPDITVLTRRKRHHIIHEYIDPYIGNIILSMFNSDHIILLQRKLSKDNISLPTQDDTLRILLNALKYAEHHHLISHSYRSFFHLNNSIIPVSTYTPEQVTMIFETLRYDPLCNFYKLIYFTLLQNMELKALRLSDIDLANHTLYVRKTVRSTTHKTSDIISSSVTRLRAVPITHDTEEVIQDEISRREEKEHGFYWKEPEDDYLFVHRDGTPYRYIDSKEASLLVETVTGIHDFSLKSLRLTAVSAMLDQDISPVTIKNILGIDRLRELRRMEIQIRL